MLTEPALWQGINSMLGSNRWRLLAAGFLQSMILLDMT
jgi:hypothetical protein